ncbi:MAG: CPBP family intramembrane metalloprotease [Planctomycetaceae bacterium]|jgi:membrane protease YdiL (CAAX protease family)|nr:CPBP family intramembrane metalloprotease [Planctomycetaceae bacterium]
MFVRLFALFFPLVLTLNYFILLADAPANVQKTIFGIGKVIQFALPVFWLPIFSTLSAHHSSQRKGMLLGLLFGILAAALMLIAYFGFLVQTGGLFAPDAPARQEVISKMQGFGIDSVPALLLLGLFYSVIHSGLEEYYWRWFVYKKLAYSAVISSTGFTLHHILLLGTYFGYASPYCWIGSFGVFIGGLVWCQLYRWSGSLCAVWLSHGIVDTAIFTIAFFICKS